MTKRTKKNIKAVALFLFEIMLAVIVIILLFGIVIAITSGDQDEKEEIMYTHSYTKLVIPAVTFDTVKKTMLQATGSLSPWFIPKELNDSPADKILFPRSEIALERGPEVEPDLVKWEIVTHADGFRVQVKDHPEIQSKLFGIFSLAEQHKNHLNRLARLTEEHITKPLIEQRRRTVILTPTQKVEHFKTTAGEFQRHSASDGQVHWDEKEGSGWIPCEDEVAVELEVAYQAGDIAPPTTGSERHDKHF